MTPAQLVPLLPLLILAATIVVVLLTIAFYRNYRLIVLLTLGGLLLSLISLPLAAGEAQQVTPLVIVDSYAIFYIGLILVATAVVVVISYRYLSSYEENREEYYLLLLLAALGSAVLVVADHFASFFLGLELLSISLYTLIAYPRFLKHRLEASIKYLILAGVTAAFLLFGMALIYNELGTMAFGQIAQRVAGEAVFSIILLAGLGLLSVGLGFKLALVPFHMWTPDVYQGAPAPATAFIATVSKGAVFALMLRYFSQLEFYENSALFVAFSAIAVLTMLTGSLLALMQNNVKRILAYSSIAHLGFLLVPFIAGSLISVSSVTFYLVAYFVTMLTAFGIITFLSSHEDEREELSAYRGLYWSRPWLTIIFTAALFSLAGLPPTVGLVSKIFIVAAGVDSSVWLPVLVLVLASVIGVFYYMRVILTMFRRPEDEEALAPIRLPSFTAAGGLVLGLLMVLLIGLGVYPEPLLQIIEMMVNNLP